MIRGSRSTHLMQMIFAFKLSRVKGCGSVCSDYGVAISVYVTVRRWGRDYTYSERCTQTSREALRLSSVGYDGGAHTRVGRGDMISLSLSVVRVEYITVDLCSGYLGGVVKGKGERRGEVGGKVHVMCRGRKRKNTRRFEAEIKK
ncbi:hypothetical protein Tco_0962447 [Tanacetum coccineum]